MSKVQSTVTQFVGFNGQSVWLEAGDEYDANDPLVKAMPKDYFTEAAEDEPKGRTRGVRRA